MRVMQRTRQRRGGCCACAHEAPGLEDARRRIDQQQRLQMEAAAGGGGVPVYDLKATQVCGRATLLLAKLCKLGSTTTGSLGAAQRFACVPGCGRLGAARATRARRAPCGEQSERRWLASVPGGHSHNAAKRSYTISLSVRRAGPDDALRGASAWWRLRCWRRWAGWCTRCPRC